MKTTTIVFSLLLTAYGLNGCSGDSYNGESYDVLANFIPSGYMGDINNIIMQENYRDNSSPDSSCVKISYRAGDLNWGGVYWQYPDTNWCHSPGMNLDKYHFKRLTFYCRGDVGGEMVGFKIGEDNCDSFVSQKFWMQLTQQWRKYTIDVTGQNLSDIRGAFCWLIDAHKNTVGPTTFYITKVQFEN